MSFSKVEHVFYQGHLSFQKPDDSRSCSSFFFILQIEMKTCAYIPEPHCVNPLWIIIPLTLILILVIVCDDDEVE